MLDDRPTGDGRQILGECPDCAVSIPSANLLIRYETADGWPRFFAECPQCLEPVHPV